MEFTHFSEYVFNYVRTRMRSDSKYESFIRCGLNPHPNHFVHKYLDIFIQEDGFARKECSGRPAYYIVDKGQVITSWSKEDLLERYPSKNPRKYTMIPSSLEDNEKMLSKNKDYRDNLEANDPANAAMLLSGNWRYTPAANGVFDRSNVRPSQIVMERDIPSDCVYYRAYDKASAVPVTEGGDSKTLDPDYTASIIFAKSASTSDVYIIGNYIRDKDTNEQLARFRKKPGPRDELIKEQCLLDIERYGDNVYCVLPRDPGQAGDSEQEQAMKALSLHGIKVKKDPSHGNKSKQLRFEPFCVQTYSDSIYWVKDTFDIAVWDYMLLELENFNPLLKNNGFHDDIVDTFSSAWAVCISNKVYQPVSIPVFNNSQTPYARMKNSLN
uniref:Terminase large subunit n=1 Tax=Vibrio phage P018-4 TaxID=3229728 RepID=A0AB39AJ99_9CAUD